MAILGGSRPCIWCELVRPVSALSELGICLNCLRSWKGVGGRPWSPPAVEAVSNAAGVYVDASYRDGIAGLAVCGALGGHHKRVRASGCNQAEVRALKWAIQIATDVAASGLVFYTDSQCAYLWFYQRERGHGWVAKQVPRGLNRRADRLAGVARLGRGLEAAHDPVC
jgi:ribonuclease HI